MPETGTVDISVIMPCHNRSHDLGRILAAYDRQAGDEPFEIIAVDDGSNDTTFEILSSYQPTRFSLHPVRQEKNQGPAAARNRGIALARAPLILFIGDDVLPDPYLIRGHLIQHRRYPAQEIAILGRVQWPRDLPVNTLMQHIDGIGAQQFSYHYFRDQQEYDFRHFYTANISVKKDLLCSQQTSPNGKIFDTNFPYAAFEDVELSYRLALRGLRIIYAYPLLGYHYHYHTIWSFSTRQYRAGLMACVLIKKHPKIKSRIMGRRWTLDLIGWYLNAPLQPASPQFSQALETSCLRWLSAREWAQHPSPDAVHLDHVYLVALRYFYRKGLIHGTFTSDEARVTPLAHRINNAHAHQTLAKLADLIKP